MERVWREGQRRVMELFESTTIADVRRPRIPPGALDPLNASAPRASKAQL